MSMLKFAYSVDANTDDVIPAANTYDAVRARFEARCFVIKFPFSYGVLHADDDEYAPPLLLTHDAMKGMFCPLRYWEQVQDEWVPRKFLKRWLADEFRRTVRMIVHDPKHTPARAFNTWRGALASKLPANAAAVPDPILRYVRSAYAGEGEADFIIDFLCSTIQRPGAHAGVALLLANEPRGGTTEQLLDFVRLRVLGAHQSMKTAQPKTDLLGRFQTTTERCVLVHVSDRFHPNADGITRLVMSPNYTVEERWKDPRSARNITHIVCTTPDSPNAYRAIENTMRQRFAVIVNSGGGGELPEGYLDRDIVARGFYDFAMGRDLSRYQSRDFRGFKLPPVSFTTGAADPPPLQQRLAPFLSAVVNSRDADNGGNNIIDTDGEMNVQATTLFGMFGAFHGEEHQGTMTRFGRELRDFSTSMRKQRGSGGVVYRIHVARLRKQLVAYGMYDAQAALF